MDADNSRIETTGFSQKVKWVVSGRHNDELLKKLKKGDMVHINKLFYKHYGIYHENGYIYHLTGPSRALFRSEELQVKREHLLKVAGKWTAKRDNTGEDEYIPRNPEEAIRLAQDYAENHTEKYYLRTYNCETWASMIRYGEGKSRQVPGLIRGRPRKVTVERKQKLCLSSTKRKAQKAMENTESLEAGSSSTLNVSGLGFFQSPLSAAASQQYATNSFIYQRPISSPMYISFPKVPASQVVPAPQYIVPTPHVLYPALAPTFLKPGLFSVPKLHPSPYATYYDHQNTVTKSVVYSVLLSELLRRFQ